MPEPKLTKQNARGRPRPKTFLSIDLDNAYARLGVSPLASPDEIASRISELRREATKRARAKAERGFGEDEEEINRLDRISDEIGKPRGRQEYDEKHPQNILLTVQPSPAEQSWQRHHKAGLVSEWRAGALGEEAFVPSLRCLRMWSPGGLDERLALFLSGFTRAEDSRAGSVEQSAQGDGEAPELRVSPGDLERLTKEKEDV